MRAKGGIETAATAMMRLSVPIPSAAITAIASRKPGMAIRISSARMLRLSTRPP